MNMNEWKWLVDVMSWEERKERIRQNMIRECIYRRWEIWDDDGGSIFGVLW